MIDQPTTGRGSLTSERKGDQCGRPAGRASEQQLEGQRERARRGESGERVCANNRSAVSGHVIESGSNSQERRESGLGLASSVLAIANVRVQAGGVRVRDQPG